MDNIFEYKGVVTLLNKVNNKVVRSKHYNSGTNYLFETYARALTGENISSRLPSKIDVGDYNARGLFESALLDGVQVIKTFNYPNGSVYNVDYNYRVPFTRISAVITSENIAGENQLSKLQDSLYVVLKTSGGNELAKVRIDGLKNSLKGLNSGVQLMLLWDLYVTNSENGGN